MIEKPKHTPQMQGENPRAEVPDKGFLFQRLLQLLNALSMPEEVITAAPGIFETPAVQEILASPLFLQLQDYRTALSAHREMEALCDPQENGLDLLVLQLCAALCRDPFLPDPPPELSGSRLDKEQALWSGQHIGSDIVMDTLKAFSRFVREYQVSYGHYGFDRGFWTIRQINGRLFRLGTLEYELDEEHHSIAVHIPGDASLQPEALQASFQNQEEFFRTHFPKENRWPRTCESWLLAPALQKLLPESSRILQFQRLFTVTRVDADADDYLEWVFHFAAGQQDGIRQLLSDSSAESRKELIRRLPEDTSLQRNMKAYVLQGGRIGIGEGFLTGF